MAKQDGFPAVFARLREVLVPHAGTFVVTADGPEHYALDAPPSVAQPTGLFFGAAQLKKNDVGFHLMALYVFPDLLDGASDRLRKRMQGQSCFNFVALDDEAAAELARLAAGYERYRRAGFVAGLDPEG
jgi:hypothetical protein